MEMLLIAAMTALAVLIVMWKMNIRRWLAFEVPIDIIVTVGLGALGAATGTFSGLVVGVFAGLIFSFVIAGLKKVLGYERLTRKGWQRVAGEWRVSHEHVEEIKAALTKSRGA